MKWYFFPPPSFTLLLGGGCTGEEGLSGSEACDVCSTARLLPAWQGREAGQSSTDHVAFIQSLSAIIYERTDAMREHVQLAGTPLCRSPAAVSPGPSPPSTLQGLGPLSRCCQPTLWALQDLPSRQVQGMLSPVLAVLLEHWTDPAPLLVTRSCSPLERRSA